MARKPKTTLAGKAGLTYLGPNTGFSDGKTDTLLTKGKTYPSLPVDHPVVAGLIARKLLVPADDAVQSAPVTSSDPEPFTGTEF